MKKQLPVPFVKIVCAPPSKLVEIVEICLIPPFCLGWGDDYKDTKHQICPIYKDNHAELIFYYI